MKIKHICTVAAALCAAACLAACQADNTAADSADDTDSSVTVYASQVAASDTDSLTDTDSYTDTQTDTDTDEVYSDYDETSSEETEYTDTDTQDYDTESDYTSSEDEDSIVGSWSAQYILNEDNEAVDGSVIYGTAYTQYGGTLTLDDDGTFSVRMGVGTDDNSTTGTYTFDGETLTLQFYDDSVTECAYVQSYDGTLITMPIDLFGDEYTVYFALSW